MRYFCLSFLLSLAACASQSADDPWTVKGEIPFDGKLMYSK